MQTPVPVVSLVHSHFVNHHLDISTQIAKVANEVVVDGAGVAESSEGLDVWVKMSFERVNVIVYEF